MSEPVTVKLKTPVEFGSQTVAELTFRRGKFVDLKGVNAGPAASTEEIILVASRLSGQPVGVIERLDEDDVGEVFLVVMGFFARCLTTGKSPSAS